MARQVLPIVGAVIGSYFGMPQVGWMVGSLVGNAVDPQVLKGPRIGDIPVQTAQDGLFLPFGYGTWITSGNIIDRSDPRIVIQEEQQGKGGGPVVESERMLIDYAIRICESIDGTACKIVAVTRVWENEQLVYDVTPGSTITRESADWAAGGNFYYGEETQLPSATLETIHGAGNVPAYRGRCYMERIAADVTDKGKAIPHYRFEVVTAATTTSINWLASGSSNRLARAGIGIPSWTQYTAQPFSGYLYNHKGIIYNGQINGSGFRYSQNSGDSWTQNDAPGSVSAGGGRLVFTGGYVFICGGVSTMQRYAAGAWSTPSSDTRSRANSAVVLGGTIIAASIYNPKVTASSDFGATWFDLGTLSDVGYSGSPILATDGTALLALTTAGSAGSFEIRIRRSFDGGLNWSTVYTFSGTSVSAGDIIHTVTGFVAALHDGRVAYSADGITWQLSGQTLPSSGGAGVYQLASAYGLVLAACSNGTVWISEDSGVTWAQSPSTGFGNAYGVTHTPPFIALAHGTSQLSIILTDIADRCGVAASRIDVSELTDQVRGYAVRNEYQGAAVIRPLQQVFFFDSYDADGKTWFPKRGAEPVLTLTADDLVDDPEFDESDRKQEVEYPRVLHLLYASIDNAHAPADQPSVRISPDVRVRGEMSVEVAVTLNDDEAAQTADKMHKVAWTDLRGRVQITIPGNYARLTPTDVVLFDYEGRTRRLAIEKRQAADGVLRLTCRHERQSNYTSDVTGYPMRPQLPPSSTFPGETDFIWMNLPVVIDNEDELGFHVAVAGSEAGWTGARVDMSGDSGANYTPIATLNQSATIGYLLAAVGNASKYTTDTQNELRIALTAPISVLESSSRLQVLRSANALAIVKSDATVEIVQFQDVVEESNNVWVCTTLLRGRRNTTPQAHVAGSRVVLLRDAEFLPQPVTYVGDDLWFRATSVGNSPDDSEELVRTWSPAWSQREWAPCYLRTSRSGDNLTATWSPRPRLGDSRLPYESVNFDGYRVTLTKSGNSTTFDTTATTFTVDTSALGSAPVTISIRGINRITGVGDELTGSA